MTQSQRATAPATGRDGVTGPHLRVDPIACDGVGICSHLVPELVTMDSWGYPIVDGKTLDQRLLRKAKAAITACPKQALFLRD